MFIEIMAALTLGASGAQEDQATELSDIIVTASPAEARALRFIDQISAQPGGRRLARWEGNLCVSVAGLDAAYGQFLLDRVSAVGASVGLAPGRPGCKPHVLIIFTADPDAAAARLIEEDQDTLRPDLHGRTDRGGAALQAFRTSDAPVRWWHVSAPVSALTGELALAIGGETGPVVMNAPNASRLFDPTREALQRAVIIVDVSQLTDVSFGALGEYLGMVTLAQIEPQADVSAYPSILNLFAGSPGQRITDWDQDYLQALYGARGDRPRFAQQASDIAERMVERGSRRGEEEDSAESAN